VNKKTLNFIFIFINILLYLIAIGLWLSITDEFLLNSSVTVVSLVLTVILLITNQNSFKHFYKSRYFAQLSSYLFTIFLSVFILGLINYFAFKNPISIDVSPQKINSLTTKSKSIVKEANDVTLTVFTLASGFRQISAFLELYRLENRSLKIEMIDAEVNPVKVKEFGVTKIPTIHFQKGERQKSITELSELSITNAIYQVNSGEIPEVYITTGHGEIDFNSKENEGASVLFQQLKNSNLKLNFVNLSEVEKIPVNVKALIIWGPQSSFFQEELKMIDEYILNGGNLMLALDPQLNSDNNSVVRDWLSKKWGISLDNNVVIDRLKHIKGSDGTVPILAQFDKEHPITKDIKHVVFFPITSAVGLTDEVMDAHKNFTILASSMPYPAAWAEYGLGEIISQKPLFTKGEDVEGPVGYAGALELKNNRILIYGNSTFVINTYQKFPKNAGFFLSGLSWLLGRDEMITLDSPVVKESPVFINQHQIGLILYATVLFIPLLLIATAIFFYWRKRAS
jgi:ABC-type uncharacterized transport system involved in gliding motility auxiliary subunit